MSKTERRQRTEPRGALLHLEVGCRSGGQEKMKNSNQGGENSGKQKPPREASVSGGTEGLAEKSRKRRREMLFAFDNMESLASLRSVLVK